VSIQAAKGPARFPSGKGEVLKRAEKAAAAPMKVSAERVDVRGMRADEALARIEQFMDRSFGSGQEGIQILHGHGTGALKQTIREFLDRSAYVRMYRPGADQEGGDAVTVVAFRS
jgi:DNA mismatch repair protein MutS2